MHCPRQGLAPCCSCGVAKAIREDLHEMTTPEMLSLGCEKVSEHRRASTTQFGLKPRRVLELGSSTEVSVGLGEWRIIPGNDAPLYRGCPEPPWLEGFVNGKVGLLRFFSLPRV